jgi:hypothetical protein
MQAPKWPRLGTPSPFDEALERERHRSLAHGRAIPGKAARSHLDLAASNPPCKPHKSDRLLSRSAGRAGNAGHRYRNVGAATFQRPHDHHSNT